MPPTLRAPQASLPFAEPLGENPRYLSDQLITYIGNKRALLGPIESAVQEICAREHRHRLRILDAFTGSGSVARLLKRYAEELFVNDLESYSAVIGRCFLANRENTPYDSILDAVARLNHRAAHLPPLPVGFIERLYAPRDESDITPHDRVFYTRANARRLDLYRQGIDREEPRLRDFLLGPLLSAASIHANTAGVFKGFYKDRHTGIGQFGGSGRDALSRILAPIVLQPPVLSNYSSNVTVLQVDANTLPEALLGSFDVAYLDPPYNQHPYGSNYFMLNLLVSYREPVNVSKVSGIPTTWTRSRYNKRQEAFSVFRHLVRRIPARYLIISYNDEGFISIDAMRDLLRTVGIVEERQLSYATFRGSRNLAGRTTRVTEHLFVVRRTEANHVS